MTSTYSNSNATSVQGTPKEIPSSGSNGDGGSAIGLDFGSSGGLELNVNGNGRTPLSPSTVY